MDLPKLACCNFIPEVEQLREFALANGLDGVDWSFTRDNLPRNPGEESTLVKTISSLHPLEVRYHCAFEKIDLGDIDPARAKEAALIVRYVCRLVSKLGGRFLTIHVGLGRSSTNNLLWDSTVEGLAEVSHYANSMGIYLCLENLAWGWTSRPELFEKLLRKSGAWATLDIGHARVCSSVMTQHYEVEDFVAPHPERFLSAHVYHEEEGNCHLAPDSLDKLEGRLRLLRQLTRCDWWVLELREERALLDTLGIVRQFLDSETNGNGGSVVDASDRLAARDPLPPVPPLMDIRRVERLTLNRFRQPAATGNKSRCAGSLGHPPDRGQ